ncbi:MAG TPA: SDR family NAD(P)-dependent oxidoreductase [Candidatus Limnocylindria bacterium]|nr:SDR family NAD(P)-dependent oxidoreductase [Candidatus Limnocylindria bacterium]
MKYTKEDLAFFRSGRAVQRTTAQGMAGKVCVVSGATSGVGLAAARRLAQGGASLVLVSRNPEKAEAVREELAREHGASVELVTADFCDLESVRRAAAGIRARHPKIDVLINSAGVYSTRRRLTKDGNETVFQVSHIAAFLLTALLLEPLRRGGGGRVVQVNSEGHRFGGLDLSDLDWKRRFYVGLRAYGASKIAQIMTVRTLARMLSGTGVTVNAMHPGGVKTAIGLNNGFFYRTWQSLVIRPLLKDPAISGEALYFLAAAPEMEGVTGKYFHLTVEERPLTFAMDETVAAQVWDKTLELAGLTPEFLEGAVRGELAGEDGGGQA